MLPPGAYAIADGSAGRPILDLAGAFVRGGAAVVQLRLKDAGAGELLRLAREARRICAGLPAGVPPSHTLHRLTEQWAWCTPSVARARKRSLSDSR